MGLEIVLEDEFGNQIASIEDPTNILHRVLPSPADSDYHYLNRVDWYGDTTFNRLQIPEFRQELQRLIGTVKGEEAALLKDIDTLAARCGAAVHLYLKFYGD